MYLMVKITEGVVLYIRDKGNQIFPCLSLSHDPPTETNVLLSDHNSLGYIDEHLNSFIIII